MEEYSGDVERVEAVVRDWQHWMMWWYPQRHSQSPSRCSRTGSGGVPRLAMKIP